MALMGGIEGAAQEPDPRAASRPGRVDHAPGRVQGRTWPLTRVDPLLHTGEGAGAEGGLLAPMPGKVIALVAAEGAKVEKGAPLLILEAMKMEHTITAPAAGTVKAFRFGVGDQVGDGAELVEFEAAA